MRRNLIPARRFTCYLLFNNSLEQLYNSIKIDTESLMFGIEYTKDQIELVDRKQIWEVVILLSKGAVKFRARDSWLTNWGEKNFPTGNTIYFGDNIKVEEGGRYHVTLNLSKNIYEFEKLKD